MLSSEIYNDSLVIGGSDKSSGESIELAFQEKIRLYGDFSLKDLCWKSILLNLGSQEDLTINQCFVLLKAASEMCDPEFRSKSPVCTFPRHVGFCKFLLMGVSSCDLIDGQVKRWEPTDFKDYVKPELPVVSLDAVFKKLRHGEIHLNNNCYHTTDEWLHYSTINGKPDLPFGIFVDHDLIEDKINENIDSNGSLLHIRTEAAHLLNVFSKECNHGHNKHPHYTENNLRLPLECEYSTLMHPGSDFLGKMTILEMDDIYEIWARDKIYVSSLKPYYNLFCRDVIFPMLFPNLYTTILICDGLNKNAREAVLKLHLASFKGHWILKGDFKPIRRCPDVRHVYGYDCFPRSNVERSKMMCYKIRSLVHNSVPISFEGNPFEQFRGGSSMLVYIDGYDNATVHHYRNMDAVYQPVGMIERCIPPVKMVIDDMRRIFEAELHMINHFIPISIIESDLLAIRLARKYDDSIWNGYRFVFHANFDDEEMAERIQMRFRQPTRNPVLFNYSFMKKFGSLCHFHPEIMEVYRAGGKTITVSNWSVRKWINKRLEAR